MWYECEYVIPQDKLLTLSQIIYLFYCVYVIFIDRHIQDHYLANACVQFEDDFINKARFNLHLDICS